MTTRVETARFRRLVATVSVVGLAALGMAGCSTSPAESGGGSATSGEISWWGWTPAEQLIADEYIAAFNEEYPDIEVTFRLLPINDYPAALQPALASNTGPDVFNINPGVKMQQFGHFAADLAPAMEEALGPDWKSKLAPAGVDGLTDEDGELKGAPIGLNYGGPIWINQELFDKYDLTPPTTIDEWVKVCQQFKANGVGCFVHGAQQGAFDRDMINAIADTINPGLFSKAMLGEAKWTDPDLLQAFEVWESMFSNGIMQDGALGIAQYPDANNAFLSGQYAMIQMGQWYAQYARTEIMTAAISAAGVADPKTFTVMPIPFPAAEGGTPGSWFGAADYGLAVNAKSAKSAAATTFAVWLATSEAGQQKVGNALNNIPSLKSISVDFDAAGLVNQKLQQPAIEELYARSLESTEGRNVGPDPAIATAVDEAATTIAEGIATAAEAVKTLQGKTQ